jgi:ribosomal protein S18 acetylase RimI-like enzyme
MLIRKLAKDDAAALQACRLFGLRESPDAFLVTLNEVSDTPIAQVEADLLDPDMCYVGAFDGGELVGFMRYVRFARAARRHVAEVRSVYVKQAARGRKTGTKLLQQLQQEAKAAGLESLVLSVLEDNVAARRLYESSGFRLYGTEPRAIRKGDRTLAQSLYELDLSGS